MLLEISYTIEKSSAPILDPSTNIFFVTTQVAQKSSGIPITRNLYQFGVNATHQAIFVDRFADYSANNFILAFSRKDTNTQTITSAQMPDPVTVTNFLSNLNTLPAGTTLSMSFRVQGSAYQSQYVTIDATLQLRYVPVLPSIAPFQLQRTKSSYKYTLQFSYLSGQYGNVPTSDPQWTLGMSTSTSPPQVCKAIKKKKPTSKFLTPGNDSDSETEMIDTSSNQDEVFDEKLRIYSSYNDVTLGVNYQSLGAPVYLYNQSNVAYSDITSSGDLYVSLQYYNFMTRAVQTQGWGSINLTQLFLQEIDKAISTGGMQFQEIINITQVSGGSTYNTRFSVNVFAQLDSITVSQSGVTMLNEEYLHIYYMQIKDRAHQLLHKPVEAQSSLLPTAQAQNQDYLQSPYFDDALKTSMTDYLRHMYGDSMTPNMKLHSQDVDSIVNLAFNRDWLQMTDQQRIDYGFPTHYELTFAQNQRYLSHQFWASLEKRQWWQSVLEYFNGQKGTSIANQVNILGSKPYFIKDGLNFVYHDGRYIVNNTIQYPDPYPHKEGELPDFYNFMWGLDRKRAITANEYEAKKALQTDSPPYVRVMNHFLQNVRRMDDFDSALSGLSLLLKGVSPGLINPSLALLNNDEPGGISIFKGASLALQSAFEDVMNIMTGTEDRTLTYQQAQQHFANAFGSRAAVNWQEAIRSRDPLAGALKIFESRLGKHEKEFYSLYSGGKSWQTGRDLFRQSILGMSEVQGAAVLINIDSKVKYALNLLPPSQAGFLQYNVIPPTEDLYNLPLYTEIRKQLSNMFSSSIQAFIDSDVNTLPYRLATAGLLTAAEGIYDDLSSIQPYLQAKRQAEAQGRLDRMVVTGDQYNEIVIDYKNLEKIVGAVDYPKTQQEEILSEQIKDYSYKRTRRGVFIQLGGDYAADRGYLLSLLRREREEQEKQMLDIVESERKRRNIKAFTKERVYPRENETFIGQSFLGEDRQYRAVHRLKLTTPLVNDMEQRQLKRMKLY